MWLQVWIGRPHTDDFVSLQGGKDVEEQVQKIERHEHEVRSSVAYVMRLQGYCQGCRGLIGGA
jgi:hypothetical protein